MLRDLFYTALAMVLILEAVDEQRVGRALVLGGFAVVVMVVMVVQERKRGTRT